MQIVTSHRVGRSHLPRLFYYRSLTGSLRLLGYFTFSDKSDSVELLSNLSPAAVAGDNLLLEGCRFPREKSAVG